MKLINKKLKNRKLVVAWITGYIYVYISMLFNGYANSNILSIEFWKELLKPYFTSEVLWAPFIFLFIVCLI